MPDQINSFTLTEYVDPARVLEALGSPALTQQHAKRLALYYRLAKQHHGKISVRYERKKHNGKFMGRLFPSGKWLTGVYQWRSLRAFLFGDSEIDIDAKSCHPTIVLHLARKFGLTTTNLERYVDNRDHYIADLDITQADLDHYNDKEDSDAQIKDMGKQVFNSALYGAGPAKICSALHMTRYPVVKGSDADQLITEIKTISKCLVNFKEFAPYKDNLPKAHPGKLLSYIVNDIEVGVVLDLMEQFKSAGLQPTIYMYDGFQIRQADKGAIDQILHDFNQSNQYGLTFIRKPFSTPLDKLTVKARSQHDIDAVLHTLEKLIGTTDMHCAQLFIDKHTGIDLAKSHGGVVMYHPQRACWIDGDPDWLLMHDDLAITDGETITDNYVQNARGFDAVRKYLKPLVRSMDNTDIIKHLNDRTRGRIFFQHGHWLDLRTGETGIVNDPMDTGFWRIDRDMPDFSAYSWEHPDVELLMSRYLNIFEDQQLKVVLAAVARAAAGHIQDKIVYLIPGLRDSGKGLLCALMENGLGVFPNGLCTHTTIPMHKDIESGDARNRSWFLSSHMHLARIAISNELVGSARQKVDGNTLKSLASGGDKIKAREIYGGERDEFNNSTCFFFFNPPRYGGLPTVEPSDALEKCMVFEMPFSFTYDEAKLESSPIYKPADQYVKIEASNNKALGNAFIWVLLQSYQDRPITQSDLPDDWVIDNQEKDADNDNSPMAVFNRNFIFDPDGTCDTKIVREIMGMSPQKLTAWVHKNLRGKIERLTAVWARVDDRNVKVYQGFRLRQSDSEQQIDFSSPLVDNAH